MDRKAESSSGNNNNLTKKRNRFFFYCYIAAAATTGLAGIIHLSLVVNALSHHIYTNTITLFLVGGIIQVFWIIPILKRWGKVWYAIGIAGTAVFIALWAITRMPGNPIIHTAARASTIDISTEIVEFAFIGFSIALLAIESRRIRKEEVL
jgi:hypothetical protein